MAKLNTAATALGRMAGRRAGSSRMLRAGSTAVKTTLATWTRVLHLLWLQITGVLFCFFALGFATRLPRVYRECASGKTPNSHLVLLVCFTMLFGWFGVSSLWRASRK